MKTNILKITKICLVLLALITSNSFVKGTAYTAVASGNWTNSATWWGGVVPSFVLTGTDKVTIASGITITINNNLEIRGTDARLTVNGKLIFAGNSFILSAGTFSGSGVISVNKIVLDTNGVFLFSGSITANLLTSSIADLNSLASVVVQNTLTLSGVFTVQAGGSLELASGAIINIKGGSLLVNGGRAVLSSAYSVNYISESKTGAELTGSGLQAVTINVPDTSNVSLNSDVVLNAPLKIVSGSLMLNGHTLTINDQVSGKGTISGDENANLVINTPGGIGYTIVFTTGHQVINNFTINIGAGKIVTLGSPVVVNGNLALLGESHFNIYNEMLTLKGCYSGTGVLDVNSNSGLTIAGPVLSVPPMSLSGSGIGNFVLNTDEGDEVTLNNDLSADTLTMKRGILFLDGHNLSVNKNIAASGTGVIFSDASSTISIVSPNSTGGPLAFSSEGNTVKDFNINIENAGSVIIGSDLVISGTLNLIKGHINTGSNNLQIASSGNITGANAGSYVITGNGGYLTMYAEVSVVYSYPVGSALYYSPASITLNPGSSTGPISVNVSAGGAEGTPVASAQPMVNSIWSFQTSITSGLNADMQLFWPQNAEQNGFVHKGNYVSQYVSDGWDFTNSSSAYAVAGGYSIQRKGITSLSPATVFDKNATIATNEKEIAVSGSFDIHPNPVSGNLYVKNNTGDAGLFYVNIFNMLGQEVGTYKITNQQTTIPVQGLSYGQYFIKVHNDKMATVKMFAKM